MQGHETGGGEDDAEIFDEKTLAAQRGGNDEPGGDHRDKPRLQQASDDVEARDEHEDVSGGPLVPIVDAQNRQAVTALAVAVLAVAKANAASAKLVPPVPAHRSQRRQRKAAAAFRVCSDEGIVRAVVAVGMAAPVFATHGRREVGRLNCQHEAVFLELRGRHLKGRAVPSAGPIELGEAARRTDACVVIGLGGRAARVTKGG